MTSHSAPNMDFSELVKPVPDTPVPPSVTSLVSLFLILITFFIIMNRSAIYDENKKDIIVKSMHKQFGTPTDDQISFGILVPPKAEEFALELEKLFGDNAVIKSTVTGEETTLTASKNFFYLNDEADLREDKLELLVRMQKILTRLEKGSKVQITFILSMQDYELDKLRAQNFRSVMARPTTRIVLDPDSKDKFAVVVKYD